MLLGDRVVLETDITFTCPTVQTRGVTLCFSQVGSGIALGDSAGTADVLNASGQVPAGLLMNDVVDIDLTRYHLNWQKDEVQIGMRVVLLRKGRVTIDQIVGTPQPGQVAYLTNGGQITPTMSATGGFVATPKVGRFHSGLDANGFAAVDFNLPVA